jgi:hypothetical protein
MSQHGLFVLGVVTERDGLWRCKRDSRIEQLDSQQPIGSSRWSPPSRKALCCTHLTAWLTASAIGRMTASAYE